MSFIKYCTFSHFLIEHPSWWVLEILLPQHDFVFYFLNSSFKSLLLWSMSHRICSYNKNGKRTMNILLQRFPHTGLPEEEPTGASYVVVMALSPCSPLYMFWWRFPRRERKSRTRWGGWKDGESAAQQNSTVGVRTQGRKSEKLSWKMEEAKPWPPPRTKKLQCRL